MQHRMCIVGSKANSEGERARLLIPSESSTRLVTVLKMKNPTGRTRPCPIATSMSSGLCPSCRRFRLRLFSEMLGASVPKASNGDTLLKICSARVPHGGEDELGEIFRGWSKEGAGQREMESDVVSALISKSYRATEELTFLLEVVLL